MTEPLIVASGLVKRFAVERGLFQRSSFTAVDDVGLSIAPGKTLALVGESGSGKSTVGRLLVRLLDPDRGTVRFRGQEITGLAADAFKPLRRSLQIVFQDPLLSLNPRRTIRANIARPLANFGVTGSAATDRVAELLRLVGLDPSVGARFAGEISGGQCQRVAIARALTLEPSFIVLDEPVSALDVSIQAQILNLLLELQERLGLSYLFITHDLRLASIMAPDIAVMQQGRIVERGGTAAVLA